MKKTPKPTATYSRLNPNPKRETFAFDTLDERRARNKDVEITLNMSAKSMLENSPKNISVQELYDRVKQLDIAYEVVANYFAEWIEYQKENHKVKEVPTFEAFNLYERI